MMTGVLSADVPKEWGFAKPLIAKGCKYSRGKYRANDFYPDLLEGDMQLWINKPTAAAITEIKLFPHKKVCCVIVAGGRDINQFKEDLQVIEMWAKSEDCDAVQVVGRPGWQRVLKEYELSTISLERSLK